MNKRSFHKTPVSSTRFSCYSSLVPPLNRPTLGLLSNAPTIPMATHHNKVVDSLIAKPFQRRATLTYVYAAFAGIAWYNAIELVVLCLVSFKRRRGCYFWSLMVASASIIPNVLGWVLLLYPTGVSVYVSVTLSSIGFCGMVTGQSLVLWSRLYLVVQNRMVLQGVLWMIIIDAVILHVPTIVLLYGTVSVLSDPWSEGYNIMQHIQLIWFCMQELIISSIYIWEAVKLLHLRPQGFRYNILHQLLAINIVILILGVAVVAIEYAGYFGVQIFFKPVAYSIKLRLEYAILGNLVAISRTSYNSEEEPSSSGRGIVTPHSPHDPPLRESRSIAIEYNLPWFWERSKQFALSLFHRSNV